ncbi:MAG: hypothetical protein ACK4IX_08975 [Candidatus Sericytochromatia bacterium]
MRTIYIFLLSLIISTSFAQNKKKDDSYIIFSRVYNEPDDGPCNLFLNEDFYSFGISTKKIKCTSSLVNDFKNLKEKSFKWKKTDDICHKGWIGHTTIENQIILKSNTYLDTIYFNINEYHKLIIDYNGNSYQDSNNEIYKTLSKNKDVKAFFDAPIKEYYHQTVFLKFDRENDSIDVNNIKINASTIYGKNVNDLDSIVKFSTLTYTQSEDRFNDKISLEKKYEGYSYNNNSNNNYYFNENNLIHKISINAIKEYDRYENSGFLEILGLKNDDSHQKMKEIFPNSSKYIEYLSEYFTDKNEIYSIEIPFTKNKGNIRYSFKDRKIVSIEIQFNYN